MYNIVKKIPAGVIRRKGKVMKKRFIPMLFALILMTVFVSLGMFSTTASAAETTPSGTCGDNLTWTLDDEGTLTISGTGSMYDYSYSSSAPWYSYRSSIKSVVIGDSVTSIGDYAFRYCSSLTSVVIPDSVTSIGNDAFYSCGSLTSVVIGDSVTSIGEGAFYYCSALKDVYYTGNEEEWQAIAIDSGNSALTNATIHYNYVPEN